jgi:hypothetical protein
VKRKFALCFDETKAQWVLKHQSTNKIVRTFKSKKDGGRAGVLRKALGKLGGTVILRTKGGVYDAERNFPQLRD